MPKAKVRTPRRGYLPSTKEDPPLLRVLIAEATRRGDTLATMARQLGVTYERVAQWRRKEADIANASRAVFEAAGTYLGVPTAYVLCMVGLITVLDFTHPSRLSMHENLQRQLECLRLDPAFAGFFPEALRTADPAIQQFVVLLYRELGGSPISTGRPFEWMRSLAALGHLQAQSALSVICAPFWERLHFDRTAGTVSKPPVERYRDCEPARASLRIWTSKHRRYPC